MRLPPRAGSPRASRAVGLTATQTIRARRRRNVSKHASMRADKAMQTFGGDLIKAKCDRLDWRREGKDRVLQPRASTASSLSRSTARPEFETSYKTTMTVTRIGKPEWPTMPPETVFDTSAQMDRRLPVGRGRAHDPRRRPADEHPRHSGSGIPAAAGAAAPTGPRSARPACGRAAASWAVSCRVSRRKRVSTSRSIARCSWRVPTIRPPNAPKRSSKRALTT